MDDGFGLLGQQAGEVLQTFAELPGADLPVKRLLGGILQLAVAADLPIRRGLEQQRDLP